MIMMGYHLDDDDIELLEEGEDSIESEELTRRKIKRWLKQTSYIEFRDAIKRSVIGQEALDMILFNIYCYLERVARGLAVADSILLTAPSGCGKTETYRAVKKYFAEELPFMPCYQVDVSQFTETGFKGGEPIHIVGGLLASSETNGIGIVWLDEIDKKIMPSYESHGTNVNVKVQHGLLTALEGNVCPHQKDKNTTTIDTNNTLFIGLGAFDFIREEKRNVEKELGFGSCAENKEVDHYDVITREDLIDAGAIYEFVGRFSAIYSYHRLADKDVRKIIRLLADEEAKMMGIEVRIEEPYIKELLRESNSKYGCRLIRSMLRERLLRQYMTLKEHGYTAHRYRIVITGKKDRLEQITEERKNESEPETTGECTEI